MKNSHLHLELPTYIHILQLREIVAREICHIWPARHGDFHRAEIRRLVATLRILRAK